MQSSNDKCMINVIYNVMKILYDGCNYCSNNAVMSIKPIAISFFNEISTYAISTVTLFRLFDLT